jgi:hypothetical protein
VTRVRALTLTTVAVAASLVAAPAQATTDSPSGCPTGSPKVLMLT